MPVSDDVLRRALERVEDCHRWQFDYVCDHDETCFCDEEAKSVALIHDLKTALGIKTGPKQPFSLRCTHKLLV